MKIKIVKPTKAKVLEWIRRFVVYVIGMFFIASGVSFSRSTDWGISPVNSIPNVLNLKFPQLSMGTWIIIVFSCFILLQALILLRQFKLYSVLQLASSTLFGFLVDGTDALYGLFLPEGQEIWLKIILIAVSTVMIAVGIFLYLEGNIMSMPGEGVTLALSKRTKLHLSTCKIIFDVSVITIASLLSVVFFWDSDVFWSPDGTSGMLRGVGIGTVVIAVFVGVVMKPLMKFFKEPVHRFLYGREEELPDEFELAEERAEEASAASRYAPLEGGNGPADGQKGEREEK